MRVSLYLLLDLSLKFFFPQNRNNITMIVLNCKDNTHHIPWHLAWLPTFFTNEFTSHFHLKVQSNTSFLSFHCKPVIVNNNS